ncbi:MAG: SDR family oxidoreductase [Myxococcota bacterium]
MTRVFAEGVLEGQVALVTGGGTGIGAAIAEELAGLGADVVIASRNADRIEKAAAALSERVGRPVMGVPCDIRDREAVASLTAQVMAAHGRIDVLVNNGGGQFLAPAEAIRDKGWDAVIATNLTGTWNLTRAVATAAMIPQRSGRILNITMLTGRGFPGMAHSCAARAGVEGMTRTLAVEWATHNIQVNCIQPGIIASSGLSNYPSGEAMAVEMQREIPAKRLGRCEEVAWLVAFLSGPGGHYMTGQTLTLDGGKDLWGRTWGIPDPEPMPDVILPPPLH